MEIDLMFAALFIIVIFSLVLYFCVDKLLKYAISWQPEA
jgi:putative hydroxymethylpyrimidine transport system permease protein